MTNAQDLMMLQEILCGALRLLGHGLREVASMMLDFITSVSIEELGTEHPWTLVCKLRDVPNSELEPVIFHIYRCATDGFAKYLGTTHTFTVRYQAGFAHDVLRLIDPDGAIAQLTTLHTACESQNMSTRCALIDVKGHLANVLTEQGRLNPALALVSHWLQCATSDREVIQALDYLSNIQFRVQSTARYAEENMRRALEMTEDKLGNDDPYSVPLTCKLAGWLGTWGRDEEAELMKVRLRDLLSREE
jgi:hypothetical protein